MRPLVLNRVHWVPPELVAEVKYLTWTDDNLLRQVVYEGLREDKPAAEVRLPVPHPKPVVEGRPSRSTEDPAYRAEPEVRQRRGPVAAIHRDFEMTVERFSRRAEPVLRVGQDPARH
ncbi:MAG TPA: hypothetical protein VGK96_13945 [Candidatus Sulfotelmatobacter sp.]